MNITVREPFSVTHDGVSYVPGTTVDVPFQVGTRWVLNGWADDNTPPDEADTTEAGAGVKA